MPLNSIPATTTVAASTPSAAPRRDSASSTSGSGAAWCPATSRELRALVAAGVLRFQMLSRAVRRRRVSARDRSRPADRHAGAGEAGCAAAGSRRASGTDRRSGPTRRRAARARSGRTPDARSTRPIWRRARSRRKTTRLRCRLRCAASMACAPTSCTCRRRRACRCCLTRAPLDAPITVETCPHYLTFAADEIPDGATAFKCAPPIRERENRESLWAALAGGSIQMVASDHSPSPPGAQADGVGRFPAGVGRHLVAAGQPCRDVDGSAARAAAH